MAPATANLHLRTEIRRPAFGRASKNWQNRRTGQDSNLRDGLRRLPTFQAGAFGRSATCPLAEGEGFEPPRPLQAYPLSRRAHSTGLCHPSIFDLMQPDLVRTARFELATGMPAGFKPAASTDSATSASAFPASRRVRKDREPGWSEWPDSNLRPPRPKRGALPGCATLRLSEPVGRAVRVCRFSPRGA